MIVIEKIEKSFRGQPVLKGLDLTIQEGESLVVIGRSGCGKSVLLKHVIGLIRPEKGHMYVEGNDL